MTTDSAQKLMNEGICFNCEELAMPKCYSEAGIKEFYISGLCEKCFDGLFLEDEEEEEYSNSPEDDIAF